MAATLALALALLIGAASATQLGSIVGTSYMQVQPSYRVSTTTAGLDQTATFQFHVLTNIPADGTISFMIDSLFVSSSGVPTACVRTQQGLPAAAGGAGLTCSLTTVTGWLTISGFAWVSANQLVTLTVSGLVNKAVASPPVGHTAAQTIIRTAGPSGNLDYSATLDVTLLPSCTASGVDCSIGTGLPGMQLLACLRNGAGGQLQFCCPSGSHWNLPLCSYDSVSPFVIPSRVYGSFTKLIGAGPATSVNSFGPVTPNTPYVVQSIPCDAQGYGGQIEIGYVPASATPGALIYVRVNNSFYNEDGSLVTSTGPYALTSLILDGYLQAPQALPASGMYGYTIYDPSNPWTAWLFQAADFPPNKKIRHNMKVLAYADRSWQQSIPVAVNSIDMWIERQC